MWLDFGSKEMGIWNPFQSMVALVKSNIMLERGNGFGSVLWLSPLQRPGVFFPTPSLTHKEENISQDFRLKVGDAEPSWMMAFLPEGGCLQEGHCRLSSHNASEKRCALYAASFTCLFLSDWKKLVEHKEGVDTCLSFLNVGPLFQTPLVS